MSDQESRTLTIRRTFNAPRSLVWATWSEADHIANWWAPPGMKLDIKKHDFEEGGDWEYAMIMPDGNEFKAFGTYTRIVEPELIETSANFLPMTQGVTLIARFTEVGDQTEFEFNVVHPTEEYKKQQEEMGAMNGWGRVFSTLESYLSELNA